MVAAVVADVELYRKAQAFLAEVAARKPDAARKMLAVVDVLCPYHHAPDFASVYWFGETYYFTQKQAAVVEELWKAWRRGKLAVRQGRLLVACESWDREEKPDDDYRVRLKDIFKGHPAWGTMIQSTKNGSYFLAEPE